MTSRDPKEFLSTLIKEKVTILNQTPSAFLQLVDACSENLSKNLLSLRYVIFGGEKLEFQSLANWYEMFDDENPSLINMYGITETTVHVTFRRLTKSDLKLQAKVANRLSNRRSKYLFSRQRIKPSSQWGPSRNVYLRAGLANGYINKPALTAEKFIPNPFTRCISNTRLYKTGDLGRYTPNKDIDYLGRIDHQIQLRGFR